MNINWDRVFNDYRENGIREKKFEVLPCAIPWGSDMEENLHLTLEWLFRDGKKDDVRRSEEPVLNLICDGWFRCESEDGLFLHACYPEEIFSFRRKYEGLYFCIRDMEEDPEGRNMLTEMHSNCNAARRILWSAWNCLGKDGDKVDPNLNLEPEQLHELKPYSQWERTWTNKCSRCCAELPKALQMWVKLQHSKLAKAV
jgi:hypothetical protein